MSLYLQASKDTDTFEMLVRKVQAASALNRDTLETIRHRLHEEVITGHDYSLECNLPRRWSDTESGDDDRRRDNALTTTAAASTTSEWRLKATPKKRRISNVVTEWRNRTGERLEKDPIFEDKVIDLSVENFDDLCRLTKEFREIGEKYCECMRDVPKVREGLRIVLSNMEKLQVFFGEIHSMTFDREDSLSRNDKLTEKMGRLVSTYEEIRTMIPTTSLNLSARFSSGTTTPRSSDVGGRIIVSCAGSPSVNGTYEEIVPLDDGNGDVGKYVKEGIFNWKKCTFCIYRYQGLRWRISILENEPFTNHEEVFYEAKATGAESEKPPECNWKVFTRFDILRRTYGVDPPPICVLEQK